MRRQGTYADFLRSPYWQAVRKQLLASHPFCERCGRKDRLQVHHNRYDHLGHEYYDRRDLEVLCRDCHAGHHGVPAGGSSHHAPELVGDILRRMGWKARVA